VDGGGHREHADGAGSLRWGGGAGAVADRHGGAPDRRRARRGLLRPAGDAGSQAPTGRRHDRLQRRAGAYPVVHGPRVWNLRGPVLRCDRRDEDGPYEPLRRPRLRRGRQDRERRGHGQALRVPRGHRGHRDRDHRRGRGRREQLPRRRHPDRPQRLPRSPRRPDRQAPEREPRTGAAEGHRDQHPGLPEERLHLRIRRRPGCPDPAQPRRDGRRRRAGDRHRRTRQRRGAVLRGDPGVRPGPDAEGAQDSLRDEQI
ncbi:MAG: Pantothenate kinase type III, CoaX-like, partial [uncultured Rubrobacteraceae bacterium]